MVDTPVPTKTLPAGTANGVPPSTRPSWLIRRVLESHLSTGAPISSPVYDGHGGHPLIFDGSLRAELAAITEEGRGVREVVRAHADFQNRVEVDTPLARLDMNTQADVEAARELFPDPRAAEKRRQDDDR